MADNKNKDTIKIHLQSVFKHFDQEDRVVRERQLRSYRRLKLYWNNFSQIYWSESARDYRIYGAGDGIADNGTDQDYYDRPINVFRAFLETIIAALSVQIPGVVCVPDDADNPNDLTTAKAGDQIAQLLGKHNDLVYIWLQALYIHMTEGLIAAYVYPKESEEYGTYKQDEYKKETVDAYVCSVCKEQVPDEILSEKEQNEFQPDDDDVDIKGALEFGPLCPNCGAMLDPALQKSPLVVTRFVGTTDKPKSRVCFDVYGGLYIKIAAYAKKQCDTPYLVFSRETHYANALEWYPDLRDDMPQGGWANIGINDPYEQYARLNPQYRNAFPENQVTIKDCWFRPAAFNILSEDDAEMMKKKFPDGVHVTFVNDIIAEFENESLDDCWTLTVNPMHDYLSHDPLGDLLTNIQDIVNDLISLILQTIEHGIPQTWADPAVVNFDGQTQVEATPGLITPTKLQGGARNIGEAFWSTKASNLSPETFQFYDIINQLGQFVSGALPSIFGGQMGSGTSRTASEYALSRSMALQRLQTTWKMFTIWWKTMYGKAIPMYIKTVQEDQKYVIKDDNGNYVNVFIRKADLQGKIGSVELEAAEQIPVTDEQKADLVMRLMELNNMEIMAAFTSPENLPFIRKIVKMPEFKLPGEDDRTKQYEEINELVNSEPIMAPVDPMMMQQAQMMGMPPPEPMEEPSVPIDPDVDDHELEAKICRSWLVSLAGRTAKVEKPLGYKNVLLHMKKHVEIVQQMQMMAAQAEAQMGLGNAPPGQEKGSSPNGNQPPKPPKRQENIDEVSDVRTPIQ